MSITFSVDLGLGLQYQGQSVRMTSTNLAIIKERPIVTVEDSLIKLAEDILTDWSKADDAARYTLRSKKPLTHDQWQKAKTVAEQGDIPGLPVKVEKLFEETVKLLNSDESAQVLTIEWSSNDYWENCCLSRGNQHYVVGSLGSIYLPTSLHDIEDFRNTLKLLFLFQVSSSKSPKIDSSTASKKEARALERMDIDEENRSKLVVYGMDWLGSLGYMIAVKQVDSAYFVYSMGDLILPQTLFNLKDFKDTLNLLFAFKHHHQDLQQIVEPAYHRQIAQFTLQNYRMPSVEKRSPSPDTFFTPVKKQRTRIILVEEENDDTTIESEAE